MTPTHKTQRASNTGKEAAVTPKFIIKIIPMIISSNPKANNPPDLKLKNAARYQMPPNKKTLPKYKAIANNAVSG